jgi:hypothetical protein
VLIKKHDTNAYKSLRLLIAIMYRYHILDVKLHVIKHKIFYYFG